MKTIRREAGLEKLLRGAVKSLNELGIKGGIYFYEKGECSCCYGLEDVNFQIQGNTAGNQGGDSAGKITFDSNMASKKDCSNAITIAQVIREALKDSKYELDWNGGMYTCMFITKINEAK